MDCTNWFYLCLVLCGTLLAALAMFFNYSLKLDWRTAKLEKKNGKEQSQFGEQQHQIEELRKETGEEKLGKAIARVMRKEKEDKLWVSNSPLEEIIGLENARLHYQGIEVPSWSSHSTWTKSGDRSWNTLQLYHEPTGPTTFNSARIRRS